MTGLGRLHHPIATRSAEAQRFFDQHDPVDGYLPDCSPAKARSPHRISSETAISDTAALLKAIAIIPSWIELPWAGPAAIGSIEFPAPQIAADKFAVHAAKQP
jgi:hypothetical protein